MTASERSAGGAVATRWSEEVDAPRPPGRGDAAAVNLAGVTVAFRTSADEAVVALDDVSLDVRPGEFVALLGPSGCGKTTILNLLAGLIRPSRGAVEKDGRPVEGPSREIGYMLARSALTPWRTALRNVELGLEIRGVGRRERRMRALELLERLDIGRFAHAYPAQLSHGMQQRVAIARTLAIDPDLWLMDEPFGALDAQTRLTVQDEFVSLWQDTGKTVLFVTHDLTEAVLLADRVVVMSARPGRIKVDAPIDLPRPRHLPELRFDDRVKVYEQRIWEELRHEIR
ncbi:MAG: ABC transporter ATP-binding protein [Acidimicrobiia bacterium]